MAYDKNLLTRWCEGEDWATYLERNGAFENNITTPQFKAIQRKYFGDIMKKIEYCKGLLRENDDAFLNFVIAKLYELYDLDESKELLFRRPSRYYCIRAIRKDRTFAPAWTLLAENYDWIALLGGEKGSEIKMNALVEEKIIVGITQKDQQGKLIDTKGQTIKFTEWAIRCIKRAVALEPENKKYREILKGYYHARNEAYLAT